MTILLCAYSRGDGSRSLIPPGRCGPPDSYHCCVTVMAATTARLHGCTVADGKKGVYGLLARGCCKEEQGKVPPPCTAMVPVIYPVAPSVLLFIFLKETTGHMIYLDFAIGIMDQQRRSICT